MSLPEVLLAVMLLAITFLSLMAVLASGLRQDKKGFLKDNAGATADLLLDRCLRQVSQDSPPGTRSDFWDVEHPNRSTPFREGVEKAGGTDFRYEICTTWIRQEDGSVFNQPDRRLMQVDVYVHWGEDDSRVGYGSTLYHDRRIISEASGSAP